VRAKGIVSGALVNRTVQEKGCSPFAPEYMQAAFDTLPFRIGLIGMKREIRSNGNSRSLRWPSL